ncbi:MAG: hypothetical protein ACI9F1_000140, partial [Colwellia sp.]
CPSIWCSFIIIKPFSEYLMRTLNGNGYTVKENPHGCTTIINNS